MVFEPMTDLITIMSKLVDNRGNILIPGVQDQVILAYEDEKWASFPSHRKSVIDFINGA